MDNGFCLDALCGALAGQCVRRTLLALGQARVEILAFPCRGGSQNDQREHGKTGDLSPSECRGKHWFKLQAEPPCGLAAEAAV